jgi:ZIP family zinc transporter
MVETNDLIKILILSALASLSTGIGGLIVINFKRIGKGLFGFLGGLSTGVMIVATFFGLVLQSWQKIGFLLTTISFLVGNLVMFFFDSLIPHIRFSTLERGLFNSKLFQTGILTIIGMILHNFPEGLAVPSAYLNLPSLGVTMAMAIALHNIPEGMMVGVPLLASGVSKMKSFMLTFFSGIVELIGSILGILFLLIFGGIFDKLTSLSLAFAGGAMFFVVLDELNPISYKEGHEHFTALGIILGSVLMFLLIGIFGNI